MKHRPFFGILFLLTCQGAYADECKDEFIRLMTDRAPKEATKIYITQQIKGAPKTINWNYQDGNGNWLTEVIEPANGQWSMGFDNVLYTSTDKGKTWTKVREMEDQSEAQEKSLKERISTVTNATCGEVEVDGVTYSTIEADYKMLGSFNADIHDTFWINAETGYVSRLETNMKTSAFENNVVQILEPAPDLILPSPE